MRHELWELSVDLRQPDNSLSFLFDVAWPRPPSDAAEPEPDRYEHFAAFNAALDDEHLTVEIAGSLFLPSKSCICSTQRNMRRLGWIGRRSRRSTPPARRWRDRNLPDRRDPHGSSPRGGSRAGDVAWFELLGWRTLPSDYLAPGGPSGARTDYRRAVLEPELRSALATLNPDAALAMIDAAVRSVLAVLSQNLIENNRAFHPLLASGIPVEIIEGGETRTIGLRLLDRANPHANRLLVANQFIVRGERETIRADVAVFVNGLPLGILKLKSPADAQATLERAHIRRISSE